MSDSTTPCHIPVLHALERFLKGDSDSALQLTLTKNEDGTIILSTFESAGDGTFQIIEGDPPTGFVEVGETLRMAGRRIVRADKIDGWRAA